MNNKRIVNYSSLSVAELTFSNLIKSPSISTIASSVFLVVFLSDLFIPFISTLLLFRYFWINSIVSVTFCSIVSSMSNVVYLSNLEDILCEYDSNKHTITVDTNAPI